MGNYRRAGGDEILDLEVPLARLPPAGEWVDLKVAPHECLTSWLRVYWSGACPYCGRNSFIGHVPARLDQIGPDFGLALGDAVTWRANVPRQGEEPPAPVNMPLQVGILQSARRVKLPGRRRESRVFEVFDPWSGATCEARRGLLQVTTPFSFHPAGDCDFGARFKDRGLVDFLRDVRPPN